MQTYTVHLKLTRVAEFLVDANSPAEAVTCALKQCPEYKATEVDQVEPDPEGREGDYAIVDSHEVLGICEACEAPVLDGEAHHRGEDGTLICGACTD